MCDRRTDETLSVRYGYGAMGDGPAPWKGKRKYEEREKRKKKRDLYDLDGPLGPMSVGSCGAVKSVRRSKELTVNDGFPLEVRALASVWEMLHSCVCTIGITNCWYWYWCQCVWLTEHSIGQGGVECRLGNTEVLDVHFCHEKSMKKCYVWTMNKRIVWHVVESEMPNWLVLKWMKTKVYLLSLAIATLRLALILMVLGTSWSLTVDALTANEWKSGH